MPSHYTHGPDYIEEAEKRKKKESIANRKSAQAKAYAKAHAKKRAQARKKK